MRKGAPLGVGIDRVGRPRPSACSSSMTILPSVRDSESCSRISRTSQVVAPAGRREEALPWPSANQSTAVVDYQLGDRSCLPSLLATIRSNRRCDGLDAAGSARVAASRRSKTPLSYEVELRMEPTGYALSPSIYGRVEPRVAYASCLGFTGSPGTQRAGSSLLARARTPVDSDMARRRATSLGRSRVTRGTSGGERDEPTDDRAVGNVGDDRGKRGAAAVVEHHESRWLQQWSVGGSTGRCAHPRMDDREQHVDQCGSGKQTVSQAERGSQPPAAMADCREDPEIDQGEELSDDEVHRVAQRLRACAIGRDHRPQQERQVHPRKPELAGRAQRGGEDEGSDETARDRAPDVHAALALHTDIAALIRARWTRPCGMLPRKSPVS